MSFRAVFQSKRKSFPNLLKSNARKITPTVLLDVPLDSLILKDEIFGPLLPIVTVDKLEDSYEFINSMAANPLAAYIFTKNKKHEEEFIKNVPAGGIIVNDTVLHLANPHLPFGGVRESGIGPPYHGKFSFDAFFHKKAVLSRGFAGETKARREPETIMHALFRCQFARRIWFAEFGLRTEELMDNFKKTLTCLVGTLQGQQICDLVCAAWAIWRVRNEMVFRAKAQSTGAFQAFYNLNHINLIFLLLLYVFNLNNYNLLFHILFVHFKKYWTTLKRINGNNTSRIFSSYI